MRATLLFLGCLFFLPLLATAQRSPRGLLRVGADFGGDELVQFRYSDGTTPSIRAGAGLSAALGVEFPVGPRSGLTLRGSAGLKYRTIPPASNQTASWLRVPIEGLVLLGARGMRLGAGLTLHTANVLSTKGAALNNRVEFKPATGILLQAEFGRRQLVLDLRATLLTYQISSGGSGNVKANSIGAGLAFRFGGGGPRRQRRMSG